MGYDGVKAGGSEWVGAWGWVGELVGGLGSGWVVLPGVCHGGPRVSVVCKAEPTAIKIHHPRPEGIHVGRGTCTVSASAATSAIM